jgi:hypothetical protein
MQVSVEPPALAWLISHIVGTWDLVQQPGNWQTWGRAVLGHSPGHDLYRQQLAAAGIDAPSRAGIRGGAIRLRNTSIHNDRVGAAGESDAATLSATAPYHDDPTHDDLGSRTPCLPSPAESPDSSPTQQSEVCSHGSNISQQSDALAAPLLVSGPNRKSTAFGKGAGMTGAGGAASAGAATAPATGRQGQRIRVADLQEVKVVQGGGQHDSRAGCWALSSCCGGTYSCQGLFCQHGAHSRAGDGKGPSQGQTHKVWHQVCNTFSCWVLHFGTGQEGNGLLFCLQWKGG